MNRIYLLLTIVLALAICLVYSASSYASVIILQDGLNGYSGTRDTSIEGQTNKQHDDNGDKPDLLIRQQTNNDKKALLYFDLSSLPSYLDVGSINSVTLSLYKAEGDQGGYSVSAYRIINGPWQEGDGNNNTNDHADWAHKIHSSSSWVSAGLGSSDYDSASGVTSVITTNHEWYDWDVKDIVNDWWSGTEINYGFLLASAGTEGERHFNSSENRGNGPKLTIDYNAVPEPATMSLLGLGLMGMALRRRRQL